MTLLLPPYSVGVASVATGETTVSIPTAVLTDLNARELDLFVDKATGISAFIRAVPSITTLTIDEWPGAALVEAEYRIEKTSPLRYVGGKAMADVQRLIDYLNTLSIIISVAGDEPDPAAGENDWYALKSNGGEGWKLWHKEDGAWVLQGSPVGLTYRGTWNSATEYLINDRVSRNGTTYVAKQVNTNRDPATDTTAIYWDTAGIKGDRGATITTGAAVPSGASGIDDDLFLLQPAWDLYKRAAGLWSRIGSIRGADGGGVVVPYAFSASTIVADPGPGTLRLNNATQNVATAIVVDLADSLGRDWTTTLDGLTGTSDVKQIARLYKTDDQTKFVLFALTAINAGSGFRSLVGSVIGSSGTAPFSAGDNVSLAFARVGDKGETGAKGETGISYRERAYDPTVTYVNNATYIDRVTYDGQTWTCIAASVVGVTPGTDDTRWILAARGISPAVVDAATNARDQAAAALASVQDIQDEIDATAADASAAKDAATTSATEASEHEAAAQSAVTTAHGWATLAQQYADMLTDRVNDWGDGRGELIDSTDWGDGR